MTTQYGRLALALLLGTTLLGSTSHAQLLDAGAEVNGSVDTSSNTTNASADADASVNVDANADTDEEATGSDESVSGTATVTGDAGFNILRRTLPRDLGGDDAPSVMASDVADAAGLRAYAEASLRNDDRYEGIVMNDSGMSVTYRKDARLFGVIPSGMNVTVNVMSSGEVSVSYPWYAFLYATGETRDELESRIESELARIDANGSASADAAARAENGSLTASAAGSATASGSYDSQRWARVIERIQATLSADAETTASANAS